MKNDLFLTNSVLTLVKEYAQQQNIAFKPTIKCIREVFKHHIDDEGQLILKQPSFECIVPVTSLFIVAENVLQMEKYKANPNIANPIKVDIKAQLEKHFEQTKQARKKLGYKY